MVYQGPSPEPPATLARRMPPLLAPGVNRRRRQPRDLLGGPPVARPRHERALLGERRLHRLACNPLVALPADVPGNDALGGAIGKEHHGRAEHVSPKRHQVQLHADRKALRVRPVPQLPGRHCLPDLPDPALPTIAARLRKSPLPSIIARAPSSVDAQARPSWHLSALDGSCSVQQKVTNDCRRCLIATNRPQKPVAARLVQRMPNHAYRQRGTTPRDSAASANGLDGKLEDWTETKDILARSGAPRRSEHRCGCRASMGKGMSAVGRGPIADIPFVKTKKQDYLQKCSD